MTQNELIVLLKELQSVPKECEWVEFKVNNGNPEDVGEYISALSNSACYYGKSHGYLVFGIQDGTKHLVGTTFCPSKEKRGNQELENWWAEILRPRIDFNIFEFEHDGLSFTIIRVDAARNQPILFRGKAYIRIGSYKKILSDHPERERKIWNKDTKNIFEKGIAKSKVSEQEVLELLSYPDFFHKLKIALPVGRKGIIDRLIMDKIIEFNGINYNITNLGAIMFARDLEKFESISRKAIRVIVYKGKNRITTKEPEIKGKYGYAIGFQGLIKFVLDKSPSSERIINSLRQEFSYPEIAVRELIANAIVHQDFSISGSSPMIEIFDDRIEITNPGKPLIPTQRFIDHSPESRNEKFARFMTRMNICEERGSGIDKVIFECETNELPPPEFIEGDNFLRAIIYAHKPFSQLTKQEKLRACYFHACLKQVSGEVMTNQSLRERFKIEEQNSAMVSRIINEAIEADLIKDDDPESKSRKFKKYVPNYA